MKDRDLVWADVALVSGMDLEAGEAGAVYEATEKPAMECSPLPGFSLIRMRRYSTMTVPEHHDAIEGQS